MSPLATSLLQIAREEGNTANLEVIRNAAFAKLQNGEVKAIISTTINGKSFGFNVSQPADKLFTETSWAIRRFNLGTVNAMQWDFSQL